MPAKSVSPNAGGAESGGLGFQTELISAPFLEATNRAARAPLSPSLLGTRYRAVNDPSPIHSEGNSPTSPNGPLGGRINGLHSERGHRWSLQRGLSSCGSLFLWVRLFWNGAICSCQMLAPCEC